MNTSSIEDWLSNLGSRTPAPGGGAVAGLNAAISAATLKMVCEYSELEDGGSYRESLSRLIASGLAEAENDAVAYAKLREAYKQKKPIQQALKSAMDPSIQTIKIVDEILEITQNIADDSNQNLISDIAVSAANARSALESSIVNLEINRNDAEDKELIDSIANYVKQAESLISVCDTVIQSVRTKLSKKDI